VTITILGLAEYFGLKEPLYRKKRATLTLKQSHLHGTESHYEKVIFSGVKLDMGPHGMCFNGSRGVAQRKIVFWVSPTPFA